MAKNVAIVESPAKAKTIASFLGDDFRVESSYGHLRDLPKKEMGIDIEHGFRPTYIIPDDKKKHLSKLKQAIKGAQTVWLATDEDREGEAIAWHLGKALDLDAAQTKRIVFHEITKDAISEAIQKPRQVEMNLVNAQQARRVLDRLVGYELSPILWRKIRTGLSAGRVQSVAVRLIVEREREIAQFKPKTSFKVAGIFLADDQEFEAELATKFDSLEQARELLEQLGGAQFKVDSTQAKTTSKSPPPPFTTSTLQQTASRLLGYSVRRTMVVAQQLYEAGHITYMRTDSTALSSQAIAQAGQYITDKFGAKYHHSRQYQTKSKLAQEAHEAIRPTNFAKAELPGDKSQSRLYRLIWQRALATQMAAAKLDKTTVKIANSANEHLFIAKGEVTVFDGFMRVYQDSRRDDNPLPKLTQNQAVKYKQITAEERLSKPKARYTEASLVKKLEQLGIGRPSTYAPTISTIQDRGYVQKGDLEGKPHKAKGLVLENGNITENAQQIKVGQAKNKLYPTDIGKIVNDFLVKYFANVLDYQFTARVESEFDAIAQGKLDWPKMIDEFYQPFKQDLAKTKDVSRQEASQTRKLGSHPKSGKPVFARIAKYGPIIQVGETESEEKPTFAPIPKGVDLENVDLKQALKFLTLPRTVGKTPQGDEIIATIGPFGPYLKAGKTNASLKGQDPYSIDEPAANKILADKKEADSKKVIKDFTKAGIQVLNGPYGPYVTDGKKRKAVPKDQDPKQLTLEKAQKLISARK